MRRLRKILTCLMILCIVLGTCGTVSFANTDTTLTIENSKIFDLEIGANETVSNSVDNGIVPQVQKATNTDYSTIDTQTIYTADGATNYLMIENTMLETQGISGMKARGQAALVAPTAAYSGVYAESDKFTGDVTVELWVKIPYLTTLSQYPGGEIVTSLTSYNSNVAVSTDTKNTVGNIGLSVWNSGGGKPITKPEASLLYASGGYGNLSPGISHGNIKSSGDERCYFNKWAQIVMTREYSEADSKYYYYLYINTNGDDLSTVETYSSKKMAQTISGELTDAMGLITAGMPSSVLTSTANTYNDSLSTYELGDIRVYDGIMSASDALAIYNRDKGKYVEFEPTVNPADGTVLMLGEQTISVSYETAVSEANRSKVSLTVTDGSTVTPSYVWADDYKSVEVTFNAERGKTYNFTYPKNPVVDVTATAVYTATDDIKATRIFDMEIANDGTATNIASNIEVNVRTATNEDYSTLTTESFTNADGGTTNYYKIENTMLETQGVWYTKENRGNCATVAPTAAYSGIYAESDKFLADNITVEMWAKLSYLTKPPYYSGGNVLALTSLDASNATQTGTMSLGTLVKTNKTVSNKRYMTPSTSVMSVPSVDSTNNLDSYQKTATHNGGRNCYYQWAQIVLTRKNAGNGKYNYYIYINSPNGSNVARYISSAISANIPTEGLTKGLLTAAMPSSAVTSTNNTYNDALESVEIGDLRVYGAYMTSDEALEIYNEDKNKYVKQTEDDISVLYADLFTVVGTNGDREVKAVNGVSNLKFAARIDSNLTESTKLIAALYDENGGELVAAKVANVNANSVTNISLTFENAPVTDGFVKLFIWDSYDGLYPYVLDGNIYGETVN